MAVTLGSGWKPKDDPIAPILPPPSARTDVSEPSNPDPALKEVLAELRAMSARHNQLADQVHAALSRELPAPVVTVSNQVPEIKGVTAGLKALTARHDQMTTGLAEILDVLAGGVNVSVATPDVIIPAIELPAIDYGPVVEALAGQVTLLSALSKALEKLDFRMRGTGGGGSLSPDITDRPSRQLGIVSDDYTKGQYLADQAGSGGVLTFTFAYPVNFIWVTDVGATTTNISRVDPFGGTPSATSGIPVFNATPAPIFVTSSTATIKVYASTGSTINVYGHAR